MLERDGARIWFASFGAGPAVLLLHGGMGNANNFGHQVPALLAAGYRVVAIDSRGQGRSSWDGRTTDIPGSCRTCGCWRRCSPEP